jgi:hypothetical protein
MPPHAPNETPAASRCGVPLPGLRPGDGLAGLVEGCRAAVPGNRPGRPLPSRPAWPSEGRGCGPAIQPHDTEPSGSPGSSRFSNNITALSRAEAFNDSKLVANGNIARSIASTFALHPS